MHAELKDMYYQECCSAINSFLMKGNALNMLPHSLRGYGILPPCMLYSTVSCKLIDAIKLTFQVKYKLH